MFFLAATLVGWIGGDFVYRKVAAKNSSCIAAETEPNHGRWHHTGKIWLILDVWFRRYARGQTDRQTDPQIDPLTHRLTTLLRLYTGKGKVCHIPLVRMYAGCSSPFLRSWTRSWTNHCSLRSMASATPDLRLPSQPQGITAYWSVPSHTA